MLISAEIPLQETCLASKDVMPFDLLKKKLMLRLDTLGIRVLKTYEEVIQYIEESLASLMVKLHLFNNIKKLPRLVCFLQEWSYIPVGGSLPNTEQKNLAFGAAASMVHPATGSKSKP